MRKSRFTEEQQVAIVRECDRDKVEAVAKRHNITVQTIYIWKKRFGALGANEVRRLKALEAENARLRKLVDCRSVKVKRLFFFADRHSHTWLKRLDRDAIDLGKGKRLIVKGVRFVAAHMITVPGSRDGVQ